MLDDPRMGYVQGHNVLGNREIGDNISETVQDRDGCSGRLIGNRMLHTTTS